MAFLGSSGMRGLIESITDVEYHNTTFSWPFAKTGLALIKSVHACSNIV